MTSPEVGLDYEALAVAAEQIREVTQAMVAGLVIDGFTDEQARAIIAGVFASSLKAQSDEDDSEDES